MSDPAIDAASRAWRTASHGRHGDMPSSEKVSAMLTGAAREALKPIRDRHQPFVRDYPGGDGRRVCRYCIGPVDWPCLDARDAYSESELSDEQR